MFSPEDLADAGQVVSHNVRRYRFALPEKKMVIGLPIGSHITIAAKDTEGKDVMRPYTPVTDDNSKGHVDFVIKASCSTAWPNPRKLRSDVPLCCVNHLDHL